MNVRLSLMKEVAIAAVHRTAGGVDQMSDPVVAAAFKDVAEADQIALDVGRGILERVTHPRLRSEVHHHLRPLVREQTIERLGILQSQTFKPPFARGLQSLNL